MTNLRINLILIFCHHRNLMVQLQLNETPARSGNYKLISLKIETTETLVWPKRLKLIFHANSPVRYFKQKSSKANSLDQIPT